MKSNYWEEQDMVETLNQYHTRAVKNFNIPEWAKIDCPHCHEPVDLSGIRNISLCLNARNIGDISIEAHCKACGIMNTVYFRSAVDGDVNDFISYLNENKKLEQIPIVEEEMFKLRYNNLIEKYIKEKNS